MVVVDALTHLTLNLTPHCNPYYKITTFYEHWIAKFGLPEILITDNGTEFINKKKSCYPSFITLDMNPEHLMPHGLMV